MLKKFIYFVIVIALSVLWIPACAGTVEGPPSPYEPDSFQSLDYYGEWFVIPAHGRVWRPYASTYWSPFRYGHWVWSQYGWTWISYEPYGWIVYHHGYWNYSRHYGWFWIPDYVWSPARVVWIQFDTYIGWAPMPPPGIFIMDPWLPGASHYWRFVPYHRFQRERIDQYIVPSPVIKQKTAIRQAPSVEEIEGLTGGRVQKIPLRAEEVRGTKQPLQKLQLPPKEQNKVEQNMKDVEKRVLKPPPRVESVKKPAQQKPVKEKPEKQKPKS